MSTVVIEKYVDGVRVEEFQVPTAPLRLLARLLPAGARRGLLRHGLDLDTLLDDSRPHEGAQWMDVEEKLVAKRIRISRRP
ncbi:hypothetical protein ABE438_04320 [Bosea sp. TWI1241]|uniref:hypothetical protein n=1 Tax=Bosea sp. TWI1241 TaxID=3148904 RepID=UPI00320A65E8